MILTRDTWWLMYFCDPSYVTLYVSLSPLSHSLFFLLLLRIHGCVCFVFNIIFFYCSILLQLSLLIFFDSFLALVLCLFSFLLHATIAIMIVFILLPSWMLYQKVFWYFLVSLLRSRKIKYYCNRKSWKINNYMGSNIEKKPWTTYKTNKYKVSERLRATTFAITRLKERWLYGEQ